MSRQRKETRFSRFPASVVAACLAVALPSAGFALGGFDGETVSLAARGSFASFTPASVDPRLAKMVSETRTAEGRMMRFTPAGAANRPDRSVTVAIRVDDETARAISVRSSIKSTLSNPGRGGAITITPNRFDLGVSRGYRSFAPTLDISKDLRGVEMPDLASFKPGKGEAKAKPGRFSARVELAEGGKPGNAPRTLEMSGGQSVDVGGSYRVLGNLDLTAGVRYSQERDRIAPLTDGTQDSQAVYVGTQFRF